MEDGRKLEKIMVRYFPPGIILEFKDLDGNLDNKSIDLLNLSENSDIPYLVQQINEKEPLTIKYKSKKEKYYRFCQDFLIFSFWMAGSRH